MTSFEKPSVINRFERKEELERIRRELADFLEEAVTDPARSNLRLDVEWPAKLMAGEQIAGDYWAVDFFAQFAEVKGLTEAEEKFLKEKFIFPLAIRLPEGDKNYMLTFVAGSEEEAAAWNYALEKVMKEAALSPFHQMGDRNKPGFHGWEVWAKTNEAALKLLYPRIMEEKRNYEKLWE